MKNGELSGKTHDLQAQTPGFHKVRFPKEEKFYTRKKEYGTEEIYHL